MEYRKAVLEDLQSILKMKNEVKCRIIQQHLPIWNNGYPFDEMIVEDVEKGYGRVVLASKEIVGYACFHPAKEEYPVSTFQKENLQSFGRVMIKEGYVGKHYGSFLVQSMIEEAKHLSVDGLGILVDACNVQAVRLYQKYGFQKEGSNQFTYAYLDIYSLYF